MIRILALLMVVAGCCCGTTSMFPKLSLYSLNDEQRVLPSGKRELVFVGCQVSSIRTLKTWYTILQARKNVLYPLSYVVVPVFPSCLKNSFFRMSLINALRGIVPKHLWHHVNLLFLNTDELSVSLSSLQPNFKELNVFLVDERGKILWHGMGEPTSLSISQLVSINVADQKIAPA